MTRPPFKAPAALFASLAFALCLTAAARAQSHGSHGAEPEGASAEGRSRRGPRINVKPLEDVAREGKELYEQGRLSPRATFDVTATAALDGDGSFAADTLKIQGTASEESLMPLVGRFVAAVGQSKALSVVQAEGAKEVELALRLDGQTLSVRVAAAVASESHAGVMVAGYDLLLRMARKAKEGTDEAAMLNGFKVGAEGTRFVISFEMPRDAAFKLIADMLARTPGAGAGRQ